MTQVFRRRKKWCVLLGTVLLIFLAALYFHAMSQPGLWYRDAFLYRQKDGGFAGSRGGIHYRMDLYWIDGGTEISFSVNGKARNYQILHPSEDLVEIYEDGTQVLTGIPVSIGAYYDFLDENGQPLTSPITVTVNGQPQDPEDLYPGCGTLYAWSVATSCQPRGNFFMAFLAILLGIYLYIDVRFPDFFFRLKTFMTVDGGEPTELYRSMQKISRGILAVAVVVLMAMGFINH